MGCGAQRLFLVFSRPRTEGLISLLAVKQGLVFAPTFHLMLSMWLSSYNGTLSPFPILNLSDFSFCCISSSQARESFLFLSARATIGLYIITDWTKQIIQSTLPILEIITLITSAKSLCHVSSHTRVPGISCEHLWGPFCLPLTVTYYHSH